MIAPTFKVHAPEFDSRIRRYADVFGVSFIDAVKQEARMLGRELMQRTPPFSGKLIVKMLANNPHGGQLKDLEIEELNARQVGVRRVEKDIRKVLWGYKKAATTETKPDLARAMKGRGKVDGIPVQMCQGKLAIRVFATKQGEVYGTDYAHFIRTPTDGDLAKYHTAARTRRGRVTTAGSRTVNVGRWKWLSLVVTKESAVKSYVRKKQKMVGQAKGGWGSAYIAAGGKLGLAGWIGRHVNAGSQSHKWDKISPWISFINNSRWASSGDIDRVLPQALLGRAKALEGAIERKIKDQWKEQQAKAK